MLNVQYLLNIFVLLLIVGVVGFYGYKNRRLGKMETVDPMKLPRAIRSDDKDDRVLLSCMDVETGYFLMGTMLWLFTALFLLMMVGESKDQDIAVSARRLVDDLTGREALKIAPFAFLFFLFYFIFSRTKITWEDGVLISAKPVSILYFEVKKFSGGINILYLQSENKRWIFTPTTSQDGKRFKDMDILKREMVFNETQVEQLKANLIKYGAQEKKFNLITYYPILGLIAFLLSAVGIMAIFS